MVFVYTVVIVRGALHGGEREVAWTLAAFGAGSMAVALMLPMRDRFPDRRVMLAAAAAVAGALLAATGLWAAKQGSLGWTLLLRSCSWSEPPTRS